MNTVKLHIAVLLSACCTFGQSTSGSLLGTVMILSGAAVPEVAISATETQTNRRVETKSGPDGQYVLTPLTSRFVSFRSDRNRFQTLRP